MSRFEQTSRLRGKLIQTSWSNRLEQHTIQKIGWIMWWEINRHFRNFTSWPQPREHTNRCCRKWEMRKIEWTHDLTWKTLYGKNHGSTRLRTKTMHREIYNGELQGDDLELAVLATGGGITQRRRPLPLSRSISLMAALSSLLFEWKNRKMSSND